MGRATTADECRLLLDMFLLRTGMTLFPSGAEFVVPYPSPVTSDSAHMPSAPAPAADLEDAGADSSIDHTVVEILLGGGGGSVPSTPIYNLHIDVDPTTHDRSLSMASAASFHSAITSPAKSPAREVFVV
jgi:hypothetical protein